ncbi:hypothetical protein M0804_015479 [Polistes exclamans]|nr:hypothetical protein M0804_015479 [Polistes exclamans]
MHLLGAIWGSLTNLLLHLKGKNKRQDTLKEVKEIELREIVSERPGVQITNDSQPPSSGKRVRFNLENDLPSDNDPLRSTRK